MEYNSSFQINDKVVYIGSSTTEKKGTVWNIKNKTNVFTLELENGGKTEWNDQRFYRLATEKEIREYKIKCIFDQVG
jgi:hypothetical protein